MAIRPYSSPGVIVQETINPVLAPLIALPSVIAALGSASGFEDTTDRFILKDLNSQLFRHTGIDQNSIVAKNVSGHVINEGAYVILTDEDPNAEVTGDEPYEIRRAEMPTLVVNAAGSGTGSLTGTYRYAVSFSNARGETGMGPASDTVVVSGAGVNLTDIPVGSATEDDLVTGRNIYRAKVVNGVTGVYYRVATIGDNVTTVLSNESVTDLVAVTNPTPATGIVNNVTTLVNYNYTDQFYWEPTLFADYDDVMDKYGAPFDSDGNIDSTLSFIARFAFANGAEELVCQAVKSNDPDYAEALEKLQKETDVNIIVVASGEEIVHESVIAHLNTMKSLGSYSVAILGADGSINDVDPGDLRETAEAINNEAIVYVSPSRFRTINPVTAKEMVLGAQYVGGAIAGMIASRDVEQSLTRKIVAGFSRVDVKRTQTEEALDSAAGLFVIRERGNRILQVRHAITTSPTNVNTRELSVVRAKYDLITRARITLESLIGMVVPKASAALIVQGAMLGILEQILAEGSISGYANVKARQLATDPTTIEVRFEYTPAYPINNIIINFTINTQTGEITATSR